MLSSPLIARQSLRARCGSRPRAYCVAIPRDIVGRIGWDDEKLTIGLGERRPVLFRRWMVAPRERRDRRPAPIRSRGFGRRERNIRPPVSHHPQAMIEQGAEAAGEIQPIVDEPALDRGQRRAPLADRKGDLGGKPPPFASCLPNLEKNTMSEGCIAARRNRADAPASAAGSR